MFKLRQNLSLLCGFILLTGCVTVKDFDAKKKVTVEKGILGSTYKQDNQLINIFSLMDGLEKNPQTQEDLGHAKPLLYTSMVMGGAGGYLVGYYGTVSSSVVDSQTKSSNLTLGIGLIIGGLVINYFSTERINNAVKTHNKSKTAKKFDFLFAPNANGDLVTSMKYKF